MERSSAIYKSPSSHRTFEIPSLSSIGISAERSRQLPSKGARNFHCSHAESGSICDGIRIRWDFSKPAWHLQHNCSRSYLRIGQPIHNTCWPTVLFTNGSERRCFARLYIDFLFKNVLLHTDRNSLSQLFSDTVFSYVHFSTTSTRSPKTYSLSHRRLGRCAPSKTSFSALQGLLFGSEIVCVATGWNMGWERYKTGR